MAVFCLTLYAGKCGDKVSVAVDLQLLQMIAGQGLIFYSLFMKTLRSSSKAVVKRNTLYFLKICTVGAKVG